MDKDLRVLVVEDEAIIALSLEINIQRLGHHVVGRARTGEEALQLAAELKPDLILMDIKMPGMDGIEAASRIMEECPTPIIFLTAYAEPDLIDAAVKAGALVYLVKPVTEEDLLPAIRLAMQRFEGDRALRKEIGTLREALEVRRVVEQAKGILMERLRVDEETAFQMLSSLSQRQNRKLVEIARELLSSHRRK